ncbi:hypothetical protein B0A49_05610 [Cryomyces minteri]|uniref:Glycosyltransferase 2-like domain-containing protein n=1 Tax=Cryomyces minteri TaxID=331657 RepID=A0A4U0XCL5_9PEZI|nr:hypothetical protein B0A49_05610 [Cryomyces minteri]
MEWNGNLLAFLAFFIFRYLRLVVHCVSYYRFKPRPVQVKPACLPDQATVIVPTTFKCADEFARCLGSILACGPFEVIVVTSKAKLCAVETCCRINGFSDGVRVISVGKLNKRRQLVAALRQTMSEITIFADDDVLWPEDFPESILASFDDPAVGAAGPRQRVVRNARPNVWNFLGIAYLERRNFNTGATNNLDGGISTLSGRTSAYRTSILKSDAFYDAFLNDTWFGRPLNTDDDKCLTRWTYSKGWKIHLQFDDNAVLETTMECSSKFLLQCVRWARAHWRGNLTVMANNSYWYRKHLWTLYAVYISQFQTPALLVDGFLVYLLFKATESCSYNARWLIFQTFAFWLFFTKIVKLIPHLLRHPKDVKFLPASVLFGYVHGFINVYACLTLHVY